MRVDDLDISPSRIGGGFGARLPLGRRELAQHYLAELEAILAKAGKTLAVDEAALDLLVERGYSQAFGARFLKRAIDEHVKLPSASKWKHGDRFEVGVNGSEIDVRVTRYARAS